MKNRKLQLKQLRNANIELANPSSIKGGLSLVAGLRLNQAAGEYIAWDEIDIGGNNDFTGGPDNHNKGNIRLSASRFLR